MRTRVRGAAFPLCCLLMMVGCHKTRLAVVPLPPPLHVEMISVPPPTHPSEADSTIPLADVTNIEPQLPRRPPPRYRPPAATAAQIAALTPPPAPLELGQLTTGGEADNGALRQETETLLRAQQRRLSTLPRGLTIAHAQQVQQAKLFLRQADEAWKKLDVEGTKILATKAKVLLDEVQK